MAPETDIQTPDLLRAVTEMLAATQAARAVLERSESRIEEYLRRLRAGDRASDIAREGRPGGARLEDNDAIQNLMRARQLARAATFRQLVGEGMSRKEIASIWGFSHQVVARSINLDR